MSRAHFILDFLIQCNIFIYSEIHALYCYDIYFDLSIGRFMSASCMSWMSAICVHVQMATFCMVWMRIVSFTAIFRVVMQHSSLSNAPPDGEGHCVRTLKMAVKETMMRRICFEIKKFVHIMLKLNIQDCCKSEWGSKKGGKGGWNILFSLSMIGV